MRRLCAKRPKSNLTTKDIEKLKGICAQVDKLKITIENARQKLEDIKYEHDWVNYLGEESTSLLTQDEQYELGVIQRKILDCTDI